MVVEVPEAIPVVGAWLEASAAAKPSHGVPPHVTILFPFVPAAEIDADLVTALRELAARIEPFAFTLRELRRWPGVLYLAPEPAKSFSELTDAVVAAYPAYPPYEGMHEIVVPHLTVAQGDAHALAEAEANVRPSLPLTAETRELVLLAERAPDAWEPLARFALGGSA